MTDIVSQIDELIDEQLAGGEPWAGYNNNTFPQCPHCDRHWHGLPITEQIAEMYQYGVYDEEYLAAKDDSTVLCQGSDFVGPMPAETSEWGHQSWLSEYFQSIMAMIEPLGSGLQLNPDPSAYTIVVDPQPMTRIEQTST